MPLSVKLNDNKDQGRRSKGRPQHKTGFGLFWEQMNHKMIVEQEQQRAAAQMEAAMNEIQNDQD